jgi:phage shock protein PspC (stress-responsive transcriptional regulator)
MSMEQVVERTEGATTPEPAQSHEPAPTSATPRPMLFRHPTDKLVGGVCGGLADYLGWDATLLRVLWVVATLTTGGGGFLAYLALWLLLPVGTVKGGQVRPAALQLNERSLGVAAKLLIILGVLWLLANVGILPPLWGAFWSVMGVVFWPALLIGVGYLLLRGTGATNDWRFNWNGWQNRTRGNLKAPTGEEMKGALRTLRERIPLKRSTRDRLFLGVCGGIGQKVGIDANLVRLIWAAFSIGSIGMGVLIYVLMGLLLPEENAADLASLRAEPQDVQVIDGTATYKV